MNILNYKFELLYVVKYMEKKNKKNHNFLIYLLNRYRQLRAESIQSNFWENVPTLKSQKGNILGVTRI